MECDPVHTVGLAVVLQRYAKLRADGVLYFARSLQQAQSPYFRSRLCCETACLPTITHHPDQVLKGAAARFASGTKSPELPQERRGKLRTKVIKDKDLGAIIATYT